MGDTRQNTHLIRDVKDPVSECAKVAAYIERTKELNKSAAWPDFAILGRTHEAARLMRAYLEDHMTMILSLNEDCLTWA